MTPELVWRWNVNDVWQSFSSMYQEMAFSDEATNTIVRYHHLSACLLFGGCAIESFLNANMRNHLKKKGELDNKILEQLRYTAMRKKIESWPSEICGIIISKQELDVLLEFFDLRNEVTHRKRPDHSLYKELDEAIPTNFIEVVQRIFVQFYHGQGVSFPYWLLGWNFVGMGHDHTHPCLINNQQFKHALNHMGFKVPAWECGAANEWEEENMKGIEAFSRLKTNYYFKAPDIEPKSKMFPLAPRLCKRWWDKKLILGVT